MELESLRELLIDQLKDIFSAENQLLKALPKMAKGASNADLVAAFKKHLKETEGHVERLHSIEGMLKSKLGGKKCKAMQGLIAEGDEALACEGRNSLVDLGLVAAAQRIEHYEMAAYGNVRAYAEQLGQSEIARLLQETLDEEEAADAKLSAISMDELLPMETEESEEEGEEEEEEDTESDEMDEQQPESRR